MPSLAGDSGQVLGVQNAQFIVGATLSYPSELNGGCVWNRAMSCLVTQGGEVGLVMLASTHE